MINARRELSRVTLKVTYNVLSVDNGNLLLQNFSLHARVERQDFVLTAKSAANLGRSMNTCLMQMCQHCNVASARRLSLPRLSTLPSMPGQDLVCALHVKNV